MAQRIRDHQIKFYASDEEFSLIKKKMEQLGIRNMGAFLRKMVLDGFVLRLDLPELKEMTTLMRRMSNNINQIAKRANETGQIYEVDVDGVARQQEVLWESLRALLMRLSGLH